MCRRAVAKSLSGLLLLLSVGCGARQTDGFHLPVTPESTRADAKQGTDAAPGDLAHSATAPNITADQVGQATWYGGTFSGRKTANGERFDPEKLTAAHRTLPFGTWVEVRRVDTGRMTRVRINDRGPFGDGRRIIDLSKKAAEDLDLVREGVARVELRVVQGP